MCYKQGRIILVRGFSTFVQHAENLRYRCFHESLYTKSISNLGLYSQSKNYLALNEQNCIIVHGIDGLAGTSQRYKT